MSDKKISIVVPVYKVPEEYLRKCIESIMNQSMKDIEILLVDDGSPDLSGAICDSYAKKDSRIRVIHKQNGGLSSARNAGVKEANGKWIMFVDGDDWIESDMCEVMYSLGEAHKTQLVMSGFSKDYDKSVVPYKFYLKENYVYRGEECKWLQEQLLHFNGNIAVAYAKLIDREFLTENDIMHDEVLKQGAEGLEFNLRLFEKLERAIFINKPFYHYIYNDTSISASHNEANHEFVIKCFEKIRNLIMKSENKDGLMKWFNNRLLYVVITTAISGYFSPNNTEPYKEKKRKYLEYINKEIVREALMSRNYEGLSFQRKIVIALIHCKCFWALDVMGKVRKWQKEHK